MICGLMFFVFDFFVVEFAVSGEHFGYGEHYN